MTQWGVRFPRSRQLVADGVVTWDVHVVGLSIHCVTTVITEVYSCSLDARGLWFRPPQACAYPCARILRALYLAYPAKQALLETEANRKFATI